MALPGPIRAAITMEINIWELVPILTATMISPEFIMVTGEPDSVKDTINSSMPLAEKMVV